MNITTEDQIACPLCGCQCNAQAFDLRTNNNATGRIARFLQEAASWKKTEPLYWLATTEEISNPAYRTDLNRAVAEENIGEREWLTAIADAFLKVDMRDGRIFRPIEPYPTPYVDDVIPNDRYMRDFMRLDPCEYVGRDRLIDLYFRVFHPDKARHFGR